MRERERNREIKILFLFFSSLTSLFDIRKSDRQNSSRQERKGSTRRGLRIGTKKHGISPSFQLKLGKSYVSVFLRSTAFYQSELVGAEDQIDPRIASYA